MASKRKMEKRRMLVMNIIKGFFIVIAFLILYLFYLIYRLISYPIRKHIFNKSGYSDVTGWDYKITMKNSELKYNYRAFKIVSKIVGKDNIIFNVFLDKENNEKTRIDMLAITKSHLYSIKLKAFGGKIIGTDNHEAWYNIRGTNKFLFYSPVLQNISNKESLIKEFNVKEIVVQPVIVFPNGTNLKEVQTKAHIIHLKNLYEYIDHHEVLESLSKNDIDNIKIRAKELTKLTDEQKNSYCEQKDELYQNTKEN